MDGNSWFDASVHQPEQASFQDHHVDTNYEPPLKRPFYGSDEGSSLSLVNSEANTTFGDHERSNSFQSGTGSFYYYNQLNSASRDGIHIVNQPHESNHYSAGPLEYVNNSHIENATKPSFSINQQEKKPKTAKRTSKSSKSSSQSQTATQSESTSIASKSSNSTLQSTSSSSSTQSIQSNDDVDSKWTNVLQIPMLPLSENLSDELYLSFESCPVKYASYQKAIDLAVIEAHNRTKDNRIVIFVVGAGRGAFVHSCVQTQIKLAKSDSTQHIKLKIYAVDKNPVSIRAMNRRMQEENWNSEDNNDSLVTILKSDMRSINPPERAHIIISELLGSFSDNELSPECLAGIEERIGKYPLENLIMIPQRYTSFIVPAHAPSSVMNQAGKDRQTPYVVKLKDEELCVNYPVECFTFHHPFADIKQESKVLEWTMKNRISVNCLIGYFECQLFKDIGFSTNPKPRKGDFDFSSNMTSWYPMLFPLEEEVSVKAGDLVSVEMYRKFDDVKVWYEWKLLVYGAPIWDPLQKESYRPIKHSSIQHNKNGFQYNMPLYIEDAQDESK